MPSVQARRKVCLLSADWHWWGKAPVARSNEENWLETQARYLHELGNLSYNQSYHYYGSELKEVKEIYPILVAGDIFDKYNPPPEVVNYLIKSLPCLGLPHIYAIPGNHDLPAHRAEDITKSAYWTLVESERIRHLSKPFVVGNLRIHPFPYGTPIRPLEEPHDLYQEIAVCHEFVYTDKTGYPGAPEEQHLNNFRKRARGYDVVVVGDNHKPFIATKQRPVVVNCGSLSRRTIDQKDYKPRVWWLYSDNTVEPHYLDISKDAPMVDMRDFSDVKINGIKLKKFLENLREIKESTIDFREAALRYLRKYKVEEEIKKYILAAIEEEDAR